MASHNNHESCSTPLLTACKLKVDHQRGSRTRLEALSPSQYPDSSLLLIKYHFLPQLISQSFRYQMKRSSRYLLLFNPVSNTSCPATTSLDTAFSLPGIRGCHLFSLSAFHHVFTWEDLLLVVPAPIAQSPYQPCRATHCQNRYQGNRHLAPRNQEVRNLLVVGEVLICIFGSPPIHQIQPRTPGYGPSHIASSATAKAAHLAATHPDPGTYPVPVPCHATPLPPAS